MAAASPAAASPAAASPDAASPDAALTDALAVYNRVFADDYPVSDNNLMEPPMTRVQCDAFNGLVDALYRHHGAVGADVLDSTLKRMGLNRQQRNEVRDYHRQYAEYAADPIGPIPPRRIPRTPSLKQLPSNFWEKIPHTLLNFQ